MRTVKANDETGMWEVHEDGCFLAEFESESIAEELASCGGDTMLSFSMLAPIKDKDPYLYEILCKLVVAINQKNTQIIMDDREQADRDWRNSEAHGRAL